MTPEVYLARLSRLIRQSAFSEALAFEDEHATDDLLERMTTEQERLAWSMTHVAARVVGEGSFGPPTGVPVDDAVEVVS